jgi:Tfp pilus assembly protein PilF
MRRLPAKLRVSVIALTVLVLCSSPAINCLTTDEQLCDVNADFALGREDYPAAILLHRRLLQSQPENALAHYHLGFAYGMLGRQSDEVSEYQKAVRLGLRDWDLFLNLGLAYLDGHELTAATNALEMAVSLGPKHAEPHFDLATAYEYQGRLGDALREITAAHHLAPGDADISNANAIICAQMRKAGCAHDLWTSLRQSAPGYAPARVNIAILSRMNGGTSCSARNTGICP